jgi:hypothetical protein
MHPTTRLLALAAGLTLALPAAASAAAPEGAPQAGTVTFTSQLGLPPEAYGLVCPPGIASCITGGTVDLTTRAEVPVRYEARLGATYGVAPLPFAQATGSVSMGFGCVGAPDPYHAQVAVDGTSAGELEIAGVRAVPGTNALAVALNHGGDTGEKLPRETYDRTDGGCGAPVSPTSPAMSSWYYHFYLAHRETQQPATNDLELKGLVYNHGAFTKDYDRFVTLTNGGTSYPVYEHTTVAVEPEFCPGDENRIASATGDGRSLGLDGASFYAGQQITAPANTRIRLADATVIKLDEGGSFGIEQCAEDTTSLTVTNSVRRLWTHVKKALAGSPRKFEVRTPRAVAGVRGTVFAIAYDRRRERTELRVTEGVVRFAGRNGARGRLMVRAGQAAVQQGKGAPRFVRR